MEVTIRIADDKAALIGEQAREQGLTLEEWVARIAEQNARSAHQRLSPKEWMAEFDDWADSFPEAPPIPDEALSRENLYPDRL